MPIFTDNPILQRIVFMVKFNRFLTDRAIKRWLSNALRAVNWLSGSCCHNPISPSRGVASEHDSELANLSLWPIMQRPIQNPQSTQRSINGVSFERTVWGPKQGKLRPPFYLGVKEKCVFFCWVHFLWGYGAVEGSLQARNYFVDQKSVWRENLYSSGRTGGVSLINRFSWISYLWHHSSLYKKNKKSDTINSQPLLLVLAQIVHKPGSWQTCCCCLLDIDHTIDNSRSISFRLNCLHHEGR